MNCYQEIVRTKENYRDNLRDPESDWPPKIYRALSCKQKNLFAEILSVEWVKGECYITSKNFSSRFAFFTGKTPKEYIIHHRIEVAKQLLAKKELKDIPISTIAYELGFSSLPAFSRLFKRKTGVSPSHWRRKADH